MELGIILLLIVLVVPVDFFIYLKINEKFKNSASDLEEECKRVKDKYEALRREVEELKKELKEKEAEYVRLKSKQEVREKENEQSRPSEIEILLGKKLVSSSDIKKAKDFIKNNNISFSVSDALVLLGKLDPKEAQMVKDILRKDE